MLIYYVLIVFPVTALVSLALYAPIAFRARHLGKGGLLYHLPRYALVGCVLSLVYLTILWYYPDITFRPEHYFLNLQPFVWVTEVYDMGPRRMAAQLVLNIGMFVPYGLLLSMVFKKLRRALPAVLNVLLTTVSIETIQYFMGRSADIDDVIMNLVGGLLGYGFFILLDHRLRKSQRWQKMLGN